MRSIPNHPYIRVFFTNLFIGTLIGAPATIAFLFYFMAMPLTVVILPWVALGAGAASLVVGILRVAFSFLRHHRSSRIY